MMQAMTVVLPFCRLVLGDGPDADAAAAAAGDADRPREQALAAAWAACGPALQRRPGRLTGAAGAPGGVAAALGERPAIERAALAAEALGASPEEAARAFGEDPSEVASLLARAHLALAGGVAGSGAAEHRAALRELVGLAPEPDARPRRRGAAVATAGKRPGGRLAPLRALAATPVELRGAPGRVLAAVAVVLIAGLAGYLAVSAIRGGRASGDPQVVTATPVGPLPPGVK